MHEISIPRGARNGPFEITASAPAPTSSPSSGKFSVESSCRSGPLGPRLFPSCRGEGIYPDPVGTSPSFSPCRGKIQLVLSVAEWIVPSCVQRHPRTRLRELSFRTHVRNLLLFPALFSCHSPLPIATFPLYTEMLLPTQWRLCNVLGGALSQDCQRGIS